jgi:hypothetical protein
MILNFPQASAICSHIIVPLFLHAHISSRRSGKYMWTPTPNAPSLDIIDEEVFSG